MQYSIRPSFPWIKKEKPYHHYKAIWGTYFITLLYLDLLYFMQAERTEYTGGIMYNASLPFASSVASIVIPSVVGKVGSLVQPSHGFNMSYNTHSSSVWWRGTSPRAGKMRGDTSMFFLVRIMAGCKDTTGVMRGVATHGLCFLLPGGHDVAVVGI